jgi:hypothetical protein
MRVHGNRELWLAFIAILIITLIYAFMVTMLGGIPPAREFFGHSIGIIGFLLMLMTETLYSFRKRSRAARWGRMSAWLDFHIFTGLVGPYLVLLHSSWKFNGLAGVVMLLTVVIVASGFIGRYIYTAVPRTADGVEVEASLIRQQISNVEEELQNLLAASPEKTFHIVQRTLTSTDDDGNPLSTIFGRALDDVFFQSKWRQVKKKSNPAARPQLDRLEGLSRRKRTLERQLNSLAAARRMMALWHTVHIPIGMVLFTAAFIHIVAAVYYATLLR